MRQFSQSKPFERNAIICLLKNSHTISHGMNATKHEHTTHFTCGDTNQTQKIKTQREKPVNPINFIIFDSNDCIVCRLFLVFFIPKLDTKHFYKVVCDFG